MVNLKALEAAITRVESIRDLEFTFEAQGLQITLRALRPDQETEVQRYAQAAMETGSEKKPDQAAFTDFMDRMRHAALGFSLVQIGDLDLRGVEYIETGELDGGKSVSVPKWEAIRDMIAREWSRTMLTEVFAKYGELVGRIEINASRSIKFEPIDVEEEITRLEKRIKELRDTKAKQDGRTPGGPRPTSPDTSAVEAVQKAVDDLLEPAPESEPPPERAPGRRSAVPAAATAPARSQEPSSPAAGPQVPSTTQVPEETGIPLPHDGDSFFDPTDPDEALRSETRRQALLRQQHQERQRARQEHENARAEAGLPTTADRAAQAREAQRRGGRPQATSLDTRTEGMRAASNINDALVDGRAGAVRTGKPQPPRSGQDPPVQLHGKPVFKMPAQTLDRPNAHGRGNDPPTVNPTPGARNERFRGPGEP